MKKKKSLINLIKIPQIEDEGYLFFAQYPESIPFKIKRIYFITKPKSGSVRGKHSHRELKQILFCLQGSVKMILDDGYQKESLILDDPSEGVILKPLIWHEMHELDKKTILLVLASDVYKAEDYVRNYDDFLKIVNAKPKKDS